MTGYHIASELWEGERLLAPRAGQRRVASKSAENGFNPRATAAQTEPGTRPRVGERPILPRSRCAHIQAPLGSIDGRVLGHFAIHFKV